MDCVALVRNEKQCNSWISSGDAFTALVWGAITRARHAIPNRVELYNDSYNHAGMELLLLAANGREQMGLGPSEPGEASRYFGNAVLALAVYAARTDLLEASVEATSRVAFTIRKTLQDGRTPEALAARVAFIEGQAEEVHSLERIVLEGNCMTTI
ncbi:hypothetical protein BT96DRAFT_994179 [Gymnopus androsaceus JB14]|uniref:Uncharacterized protein n=1 Tax=Gymnopus androsaceus JB14 TaxID=1447944 RepID=A0A6A4HQB3_9AGAR|nr:hypothetical protein BT96DRAFT_994179 [Gymnopus androsaceus JB14]